MMLGAIIGFLISLAIVIWLVSVFGLAVLMIPVLTASAMAYAESGGNWMVFIPSAMFGALVAWIDYKIS